MLSHHKSPDGLLCHFFCMIFALTSGTGMPGSLGGGEGELRAWAWDTCQMSPACPLEMCFCQAACPLNHLGIGASVGGEEVQSQLMEKFSLGGSQRAPGGDFFNHLWCSPSPHSAGRGRLGEEFPSSLPPPTPDKASECGQMYVQAGL